MAYVVVAWLLIQVAETIFPLFGFDDTPARIIVIILATAFIPTLIFVWAFEWTPEGLIREKDVDRSQSITPQTGKKLDRMIMVVLALALGYFTFDKFVLDPQREAALKQLQEEQLALVTEKARLEGRNAALAKPSDSNSIAVLPFNNRSKLDEDVYFVDGIHDDILTQLAKISAMTVIARTSVEQFRDTQLPIRVIAEQLGVTAILEGGVQRSGDRVRINVQLIDAVSEAHLWADTYDRTLNAENIFTIQTEVAAAIADAMKVTLTTGERARVDTIPTQNLAAWEAYQLGRHRLGQPQADDNLEAQRLFSRAIELDPNFALAYVGLARARLSQQSIADVSRESALAGADEAVNKALSLDPDLPEGLAMFGRLLMNRHDYKQAEPYFVRALELNPNSAGALGGYADLLFALGRINEQVVVYKRLVQLDPLEVSNHQNLSISLASTGRFDDALARLRKALDVDGEDWFSYHEIGHILVDAYGRYDLAVPFLEMALELGEDVHRNWVFLGMVYLALGDYDEAERFISEALRRGGKNQPTVIVWSAILRLHQGDEEGARALFETAQALDPLDPNSTIMLAELDLKAGKVRRARERLEQLVPELLADEPTLADIECLCTSIPLAGVLQRNGEQDRAERILRLSEVWYSKSPRLGTTGYRLNDVEVHALRGEKDKALRALREAEQAGWRGVEWRLQRDWSPYLDSIRDEPEFKAVFADIERDMASQRAALAARPKDVPIDLEFIESLGSTQ